jgi:tryptophan synthase alpha chain
MKSDDKRTGVGTKKKPQLMAHLVAGYPDEDGSLAIARGLFRGGAAMLELQFPSSDPAADGPVIQKACRLSLERGFRMDQGFALARRIGETCPVPLYIMAYGSQIYARGIRRFVEESVAAGARGIIAPDLTPGRDEGLYRACRRAGITAVPVIPAGTKLDRVREILAWPGHSKENERDRGSKDPTEEPDWVYCALRRGITGSKTELDEAALALLEQIRFSGRPAVAGFGISSPRQVEALRGKSEAIVVGSCFVRAAEEALASGADPSAAVAGEVKHLLGSSDTN